MLRAVAVSPAWPDWPDWLAWTAALAATLVLAAWCTPRAWWRRPNLRAFAVLAGGTLGFALLFARLLPAAPAVADLRDATASADLNGATAITAPAVPAASRRTASASMAVASPASPAPGARWRVIDDLNLRADRGVRGVRLRVLAAGTIVHTTGATDGDWWRVQARVDGRDVEGWASSLWLRRADEGRAAR